MTLATDQVEEECRRLALALPPGDVAADPDGVVARLVRSVSPLLDTTAHDEMKQRVLDRLFGLGPLEPLLAAPGVTEIMINGPGPIWVERDGGIALSDVVVDRATIDHLVERIVAPLSRRLDRTSPTVDGRLVDGSRVHVVATPIAIDGPYVTVRRFQMVDVALEEIASLGVCKLLRWAIDARSNILVSGGTSSGKTTLLNSLARLIDPGQRVITIEDAAELSLGLPHVVRLEARPPVVDGPPPVSIRELVVSALRMRPDRIIVGEVRGTEALDMVQAMNTGHEGSLSTCHANGPADALRRVESMIIMGESAVPLTAARELVNSAVDLVVHLERDGDGARRIVAVAEPTGGTEGSVNLIADEDSVLAMPTRPPRRACTPFEQQVPEPLE